MGSNTLKTEHGKYTGQFKGGSIEGPGTFEWNDQTLFDGEFRNGLPHGEGTLKFLQGKTLVGLWEEGKNIKLKEVKPPSRIRSKSKSKKSAK